MLYKQAINESMKQIGLYPNSVFLGYNVKYGKAAGTLEGVSEDKLIETPVAENLMMGMAIGMSLNGKLPVVYFERFDFVLNAVDSILNHLDKIELLSDKEFIPRVIIRCVVGNTEKPLFSGPTHTQDFSWMFLRSSFPLYLCATPDDIIDAYSLVLKTEKSAMVVEYKDLY